MWVEDIPSLGYKTYNIEVSKEERQEDRSYTLNNKTIENQFYKLKIDPLKGTIFSLYDKELDQEFADPDAEWQLGQFIYETTGYRNQLDRFVLEKYNRSSLKNIEIKPGVDGYIWKSIIITGDAEGFDEERGIQFEIRLFKTEKRIEFKYSIRKERVFDPEGVYVAFPFKMQNYQLRYDVHGGIVEPGKDQLPGSSSDWNTMQNFTSIRNKGSQIILGSTAMPLIQLGDINLGKFEYVKTIENPHIYSWPLNNYWVTNFKASQEGDLSWTYYFTTSKDNSNSFAYQFSWGSRIPLLSRILPIGKQRKADTEKSFLNIPEKNILLISVRNSNLSNAVILHLRELEGIKADISIDKIKASLQASKATLINVLEEKKSDIKKTLTFKPFETKFIKFELESF